MDYNKDKKFQVFVKTPVKVPCPLTEPLNFQDALKACKHLATMFKHTFMKRV